MRVLSYWNGLQIDATGRCKWLATAVTPSSSLMGGLLMVQSHSDEESGRETFSTSSARSSTTSDLAARTSDRPLQQKNSARGGGQDLTNLVAQQFDT